VAIERGEPPLPSLVVTWPDVRRRRLGLAWAPGDGTGLSAQARGVLDETRALCPWPAGSIVRAGGGVEQALFQLVGRHPFLPLADLAGLLGLRVRDARVRLERLAAAGLVRWVGRPGDPERLRLGLAPHEVAALELSELTREGLRELAASLGLSLARAERLHGLAGGGPEHPTPARRALVRALAHTLGADAVFVALHLAARGSRGDGLVRWDNAAACLLGPTTWAGG
jgi:hypothetical protein